MHVTLTRIRASAENKALRKAFFHPLDFARWVNGEKIAVRKNKHKEVHENTSIVQNYPIWLSLEFVNVHCMKKFQINNFYALPYRRE